MTQEKIDEKTKNTLESFLPEALNNAIGSYEKFSKEEKTRDESKEFLEHHNACKVSIAHIELLLKLVKEIKLPEGKNRKLDEIISLARKNIMQHEKNEKRQ